MRTETGIVTFEFAETAELVDLTADIPNNSADTDRLFTHTYSFGVDIGPLPPGETMVDLTILQPASDGAYDPSSDDFFPRPVLVFEGEDGTANSSDFLL